MADQLWYKDAIIYELHVRSFFDSDNDGIGDFAGVVQKLDYLEDLGITAIWVLPFYPSPLKDDGYDIADYLSVNSQYGDLEDFKRFLDEAHRHGIRVITELVINHTSDQHPWFQRARRSPPESPERNYYVWSDTPEKYKDASIMFPDFETSNWTWDPVAKQYYWHRFYSHQPDLNYDNPAVWQAIMPVVDFWFGLGVDGMRLDAIPYLYEREGTSCEHLPETHQFLKALRTHAQERYPDRMFLAEANAWPEEAVKYFGEGDECQMAFHFPLMPRLFMALHQEDRFPIIDIFAQTPSIPESAQWCLFLRNHDELTLALVTDEERDYMYRAYVQDRQAKLFLGIRHRLSPLLKNDRRRIEMMIALLFSLPGTPALYYGDEIGMGDNIYLGDRNGVRTPMQWSADRNAGFSRANPQRLFLPIIIDPEYHYEAVNVEAQQGNPSSLLWWVKRIIALRKRHRAFGRGSIEFLEHVNPKVLAFVRSYETERILVVMNLSRFVQHVELDLNQYAGWVPEELFGGMPLPMIQKGQYPLSLGPHGFYWFSLTNAQGLEEKVQSLTLKQLPTLHIADPWADWISDYGRSEIEEILPNYLRRRGIVQQDREMIYVRIETDLSFQMEKVPLLLLLVRVGFRTGMPETLPLMLTLIPPDQEHLLLAHPDVIGLARLTGLQEGLLCAPLAVPPLAILLLQSIRNGNRIAFEEGELVCVPTQALSASAERINELVPLLRQSERHNLTMTYSTEYILKVFRRVEDGFNPDWEITRFLTEEQKFTRVAPIAGAIEWHPERGEVTTLALLHQYVPNQGTAWQFVVHQLSKFFEDIAASKKVLSAEAFAQTRQGSASSVEQPALDPASEGLLASLLEMMHLLGKRTAELHQALSAPQLPAFAPVPYNKPYQRSVYQGMRIVAGRLEERLERERHRLPESIQDGVNLYLKAQKRLMDRFDNFLTPVTGAMRTRIHGDYQLRQLLFTGNDFVIIDFEGQPDRALSDRRVKRSPLRDVASMVRSFDYAASSVLLGLATSIGHSHGLVREEDKALLQPWADWWVNRVSNAFIHAYLHHMQPSGLIPDSVACRLMLDLYILEKTLIEMDYELTYRPDWLRIPLRYALRLIETEEKKIDSAQ
jgi:maltose alpha-D-glucosyltransferase/alpha-amylase